MGMDSGLEQFVQTFFSNIRSDDAFSYVTGTFLRKLLVFHS